MAEDKTRSTDQPEDRQTDRHQQVNETGLSRRNFLKGLGTGAVAATVAPATLAEADSHGAATSAEITRATAKLNINQQAYQIEVEPRTTLLTVLRDGIDTKGQRIDLTGAKEVCDRGACGGCTIRVDGRSVYSCMMLAIDVEGKEITTVEGLADDGELHPVQEAFIEHDALMCGFCTPGFVIASKTLLDQNPNPTREEIQAELSGNICRCGTYPFIFEAVASAAKKMK